MSTIINVTTTGYTQRHSLYNNTRVKKHVFSTTDRCDNYVYLDYMIQ